MPAEGLFVTNFMKTVSTGPSSRSYPNPKHFDEITVMNSVEDFSKFSDGNSHYRSPTLACRVEDENKVLNHEKTSKKEKKWSLSGLFRRRKKEVESESTSDEEVEKKRNFLQRRRKKEDKRKKRTGKGVFDHVVGVPAVYGSNITNGETNVQSVELVQPTDIILMKNCSPDSLKYRSDLNASYGSLQGSLDSLGKKSRRIKVKARVEALRGKLKNDSSSDDGSQKSNVSSSRFKSDESLQKSQNGSLSRRSRAARTERYIKRLTKEEEHVLNKEAERIANSENRWFVVDKIQPPPPLKQLSKPNLYYSPSAPQKSTTSTIPPSHIVRANSTLSDNQRIQNLKRNNYYLPEQRSVSYDCNINRSPTPLRNGEVMHVHLQLGKPVPKPRNPNMINQYSSNNSLQRSTPPPPPPRDPHRRIYPNYQYENNRPMSYAFENGTPRPPTQPITPIKPTHQPINRTTSLGWQPNYRSNSENEIGQAVLNRQNLQIRSIPPPNRPASATPDMSQQRFIRRHPRLEQYQYFADKTPRSRKPIVTTTTDQPYLSDSQMLARAVAAKHPNSASEFWRQKDLEETRRKSQVLERKKNEPQRDKNFSIISIPLKPQSNGEISPLYPKQVFENNSETVKPLERSMDKSLETAPGKKDPPHLPVRSNSRHSSGSSVENWNQDEEKHKSTNLEEALDELEAIYKSLHLGDEDLLDRAERRDYSVAVQNKINQFTNESQSDYSWDCDVVDSPRKQKPIKRIPDKINDDMAYRRLCKDKITQESQVPPVSYLLASPLMDNLETPIDNLINRDEPDVTLDDVVYRNLKHVNNSLKNLEHQLPFGIPLGPITAAPNSDYLHAVPESHSRSRFIPQKLPDIVKDDLAYRSLRKDNQKDPSLPPLGPDDYINNNSNYKENTGKTRKAVRSMSANVYNLMQRGYDEENEFDRTSSLTDIADAMEIAHKILKEHNSKIFSKMNFSDSEVKNETIKSKTIGQSSTETLTESKTNLMPENGENGKLVIQHKPPICRTPERESSKSVTKESTPNRSLSRDQNDNDTLDKSQLEELLNALAIQAKETSEKLGQDLKILEEEQAKRTPKISGRSTPKSTSDKLKEIDEVSEHAKLCEKLLECVVESTDLISPKIPELNEDIKELTEEVNELPTEEMIYKSVANVIVTRSAELPFPVIPQQEVESDHDYDNIKEPVVKSLEKNIISDSESNDSISGELYHGTFGQADACKEGEVCRFDNSLASNPPELEPLTLTILNNTNEQEHSSGFHTDSSSNSLTTFDVNYNTEFHLNNSNEHKTEYALDTAINQSNDPSQLPTSTSQPSTSSNLFLSDSSLDDSSDSSPSTSKVKSTQKQSTDDKNCKEVVVWYQNPTTVVLACSYVLACVHQIALIDAVTLLGLILAILTMFAAFIL